jgi:hypothetical protein
MSLLSNILKGAKNVYSGLVVLGTKAVSQVAQGVDTALTKKENKAQKKEYYQDIRKSTTISSVKETLPKALTTAGGAVVGALAGAATATGAKNALAVGKVGKAATTILGTTGGLALLGSEKITTAAGNLPKSTAAAAGKLAEAIDTGGSNFEDKTLLGIGAGILGVGLGAGATALLTQGKELATELGETPLLNYDILPSTYSGGSAISDASGLASAPIVSETTDLTETKPATKRTKRTKRRLKPVLPPINLNNKIDIKINNRSSANRSTRKIYKYQYH